MSTTVAVVLPALNEADNLPSAVGGALAAENAFPAGFSLDEVIVVDDGSDDATAQVVESLTRSDPRVRRIHHARRRGLGAAIRSGLDSATSEVIVYTDADIPVDLREIAPALERIRRPDVGLVAGYRNNMHTDGPRRRLYSSVYRTFVRLALDLDVRDVNFALKVFRADAVNGLSLRSEHSFIDAELVFKVAASGHAIDEVGFDYRPRTAGESTLARPGEILALIREAFPQLLELRRTRTRLGR